ncbi:hypothetical protein [Ruegeria arenilitoris]|uniref:hypothetical protein n=1 Tax=Ruegeria arenilitoris TaxID=1173585 RepID=UPI00147B17D5|nr:hypothetical protein [Ruegeria arenilitoris]
MFWSRSTVSGDLREWILECFDWFDEVFEPPEHPILPTRAFFTAPGGSDEATARAVLEDVKRHMGFDQPVEIIPLDVVPAEHRHTYQALDSVAGTHQIIDGVSVIRYDPEKMNRPVEFISLIAHELMHGRLAGLEHEVPGGYEAHELATDLGCIIAGFGVFQLQGADDVGWSGYMTQPSRAFALAVFLSRRGLEPNAVAPHLSSRCNRLLRRAFKDV